MCFSWIGISHSSSFGFWWSPLFILSLWSAKHGWIDNSSPIVWWTHSMWHHTMPFIVFFCSWIILLTILNQSAFLWSLGKVLPSGAQVKTQSQNKFSNPNFGWAYQELVPELPSETWQRQISHCVSSPTLSLMLVFLFTNFVDASRADLEHMLLLLWLSSKLSYVCFFWHSPLLHSRLY